MSEKKNRTEFENLMDEYLRGELSPSLTWSYEQYVEQHPEVLEELEEVRGILELTSGTTLNNPPADLAHEAGTGLRKQLDASALKNTGWFKRPVFAWSLAASLLMVIGLTLWPSDSSFVYAKLIETLKTVKSVQVEGWIRSENGVTIPYRQWVVADGTLRVELGEEDHQRVVILKGDERLIKDYDGQLYYDKTIVQWPIDLEVVLNVLQITHHAPEIAQLSFEFSKEDLGQVVRYQRRDYASLGHGPSDRKWIMEVDKKTALPTLLQFFQQIDGRWVQFSDLRFLKFNTEPAENLFQLAGPQQPLTRGKKQQFWFELCISPLSVYLPAMHVPSGGIQLYWPTADEIPAGITSGASSINAGGIITQEFRAMDLQYIVKELTGRKVLDNELSQQSASLVFTSKIVLPWEKKLEPVLDHLGLSWESNTRINTRKRYIFGQDGRKIQTTLHQFAGSKVGADSVGYNYNFEKVPLQRVALTLLANCDHKSAYTENDTIEFFWDGPAEENPFDFYVDLDCKIPQATFATNVEYLKEHFGLTMKVEEDKIETMEIRLIRK